MIVRPITGLINLTVECSEFPYSTKNTMVSPLHKKNSNLDKENYPTVSNLPVISKIYERAIHEQLTSYFSQILMYIFMHFGQGMDVRAHS